MSTDETPNQNHLGCGFGLYAMLLLIIFLVGVAGMVIGTIGLLNSEPEEARNLVHGSEVQVWRLQPMRDAGLLELTEVPAAWHDESPRFDGTTSCVLTLNGVGRVQNEDHWFAKWDQIVSVDTETTENERVNVVTQTQTDSFRCSFGPGEGADRFLRQIQAELQGESSD